LRYLLAIAEDAEFGFTGQHFFPAQNARFSAEASYLIIIYYLGFKICIRYGGGYTAT
jgi:hypothetical protein